MYTYIYTYTYIYIHIQHFGKKNSRKSKDYASGGLNF